MLNVYVGEEVMGALVELESNIDVPNKIDIAVEFIDAAPLTAEISYSGNDSEISIYVRDEMHTNSNMALHGVAKDGELTVDEGDEETVKIAFAVAEGVNRILQERGMIEECSKLDSDFQGVLFNVSRDGEIITKIVEGKRRPALLCTALFGAPRMARPYSDEIMNQFALNNLSVEDMEEAANDGNPTAMEHLAKAYLNGDDEVEQDPEKAYYWFVKLAETGDDQAMFNVGLFTAKGFGTERNFAKAAEWMQKAADEGVKDAEACVIEYRKLAVAVEKAKAGDAQAQADLASGLMKLGGSLEQAGEGKDWEESVMWAEKAMAQGNPDGYWTLALAYHHGRGVDENMNKAIELYQKGAEAGSPACQHNLGCEYMSGTNIKKDAHKAFELIKTAAEQGYGLAMRDLGRCYQFAKGTPGNMKTAVEWYEKALEVIDDPELAQKTELFKMMADMDPSFDEDYPEDDENDDGSGEVEDATEIKNTKGDFGKMAKKTDLSTGKEEEVSNEEMMEALQSEQGVIKQTVTLPDGSKKEFAIWGGYELDGYDRTLNVFMNHADIRTFIKIVTEKKIDPEDLVDPCATEEGTQVTVDFMDIAATLIYRRGQGKLSTEMYVRDERKTCQNVIEAGTGEIDLSEDGSISLNDEILQNNKFMVFALAVLGVRRYLLKEGIVKKLYDLFDESAGVVVKVSKTGNISAKIVKGIERPDLPCEVFLLGEQICRPYIDEMLGLKSSGVRKPRNPELAAKLAEAERAAREKAEAEKKRKAEEEKKAEEERKRREEEKKRRAEEEARRIAAEAKAKLEADQKAWEEEVTRIKATREEALAKRLSGIEKNRKTALVDAEEKRDNKLSQCEKSLEETKKSVSDMESELSSLGFFAFGRKSELKKAIEIGKQRIQEFVSEKELINKTYEEEVLDIKKRMDMASVKARPEVEINYPIPESPAEKERKRKEAEEAKRRREEREKARKEAIKNMSCKEEKIYELLEREGEPLKATEIALCVDYTTQVVSATLKGMEDKGIVERIKDGKTTRFTLS